MKFTALIRTSTTHQENSFATQMDVINSFVNRYDGIVVNVFKEMCSGGKDERPVLNQAVESCLSDGSTLIVAYTDRLSRMMLNLRTMIAEEEKEAIRRRIKHTIKTLKENGREWGRKDLFEKEGKKARTAYKNKRDVHAEKMIPRIKSLRLSGITSYNQIAKHLNSCSFKTVNQRKWFSASVRNFCLTYIQE